MLEADRTRDDPGLPAGSSDAAIWQPEGQGEYHPSLSSRTRFPTLFDRYSTRFGMAVPNPDLKSERALNTELGYSGELGPVTLNTALFYSKVKDVIQSVPTGALDGEGRQITQSRNVGDGVYKGFEVSADWQLADSMVLVANDTYMHRMLNDPLWADYRPTQTPRRPIVVSVKASQIPRPSG